MVESVRLFHYGLLVLFFSLVIGGLFYVGPLISLQPVNVIPIGSCGTLNQSNSIYQLQNNITNNGTCFTLTVPNIIFEGQGYNLVGNSTGNAFVIQNSNISIMNITLENFSRAISSFGPYYNHLFKDLFLSDHFYGFNLISADNSVLENIYVTNSTTGIYLNFAKNVTLKNLNLSDNFIALSLQVVSNSSVSNSFFNNNRVYGLQLNSGSNNSLYNLTATGSDKGIAFSSTNNIFLDNYYAYNNTYGLYTNSCSRCVYMNGVSHNNTYGTFNWFNSYSLAVNLTSFSNVYGTYFWHTQNTSFVNVSSYNNSYGILSSHSKNISLFSSSFFDNNGSSMWLTPWANDTHFVDSYVDSYLVSSYVTDLSFELTDAGAIYLRGSIAGAGSNLSDIIRIKNNSATVESSLEPGLNLSALVFLYLDSPFVAPLVYRNDLLCPSNICSLITQNGVRYSFAVTSWTNYSIVSAICGDLLCNGFETCSTCSSDCGSCSIPPSNSGGGSGSGSGSGGSGRSSGGGSSNSTVIPPNSSQINNGSLGLPGNATSSIALGSEQSSGEDSSILRRSLVILLLVAIIFVIYLIINNFRRRLLYQTLSQQNT